MAVNTRRLSIGLLVLFAFAGSAAGALPARAQAGWLDVPLTQWNRAGTALPAPPPVNASGNDTRCADEQRPPERPRTRLWLRPDGGCLAPIRAAGGFGDCGTG